ncbi:MAG: helix-turn-helix domain-containing protein [Microbacterium sp.]|uniref:helix-turn-helix domain-containing protein n=1 Tax=Microbacterium sp. TaxID=51671 RepID=UPI0039E6B0D4
MTQPPPPDAAGLDVSGYVRRARRQADLSQRELATAVGVSQSAISRIEQGGAVEVTTFAQILATAGLRIAVVDPHGQDTSPMPADVFHDRAGRRMPAHLDVHAPPELPTIRMLLRSADAGRRVWYHRRRDRDLLRQAAAPTPEQLTTGVAAAARRRRSRAAGQAPCTREQDASPRSGTD